MNGKEHFGAIIRARIKPEQIHALKEIARAREVSVSAIMREAVRLYLFHHPAPILAPKAEELADV